MAHFKRKAELANPMIDVEPHSGDWTPATEADRKTIYVQLERMLESPLFRNSKRYPVLLRYLVEQSLEGNRDLLKERLLGVTVFHRPADYDTSEDTIVRLTAGEVRKRIAQYYHQPEHSGELRIDLRPGSYVPVFNRAPEERRTVGEQELEVAHQPPTELNGLNGSDSLEPSSSISRAEAAPARRFGHVPRRLRWLAAMALVLVASAASILWWQSRQGPEDADRQIWAPILNEPGQVRLVLPDLSASLMQNQNLPGNQASQVSALLRMGEMVNYRDSLAESGIVAFLAKHNKPYALELSTQATYPDLQRGASVLIGGLDNMWTMRLTEPLRFHFVRFPSSFVYAIEDRRHPELGGWHVDLSQAPDHASEDFALVARIFDQTTGRPVLVVAGLGANGTTAAAQFLLDPARTAELTAHAPRNWQRLNMEAVLRTQILDNHAGPPHLVACEFW
jgi:hypothetical protein